MPKLQLKILTATSVKVDEPVDMVIMRCVYEDLGKESAVGDIGILPGHMPLSALLGISPLRIINDGNERILAVFGGIVNVRDDVVTLMTERAEWPEDIDLGRAEAARATAESAREALDSDAELRSNQINLRRALVEIEVSTYPLVGRK